MNESTKELINKGAISNDNIRFFLGYTGWDENQLENEMESNSIITSNSYENKINKNTFLKEQILELGNLIWSNAPENI
jgi:putative transcriptional regulator